MANIQAANQKEQKNALSNSISHSVLFSLNGIVLLLIFIDFRIPKNPFEIRCERFCY